MFSASSSDLLAKEATWTSGPIRVDEHTALRGMVFASKAGTLHVEQSIDGENWDIDTEVTVEAGKGKAVAVDLSGRFWRLRYVNGAAAQEAFRVDVRAIPR